MIFGELYIHTSNLSAGISEHEERRSDAAVQALDWKLSRWAHAVFHLLCCVVVFEFRVYSSDFEKLVGVH